MVWRSLGFFYSSNASRRHNRTFTCFNSKMTKRNYLIDALRGICILFVILRHVHIRIPFQRLEIFQNTHEWVWKFFFLNGNEGVIVFFVISGFLITSNTLYRYGALQYINFSKFYRMRFARIAPPLFLLLLILSLFHIYEVEDFVISSSKSTLGVSLFSAITFHLNWLEGQVGYLPGNWDVLWSLSVEEVFYFAFPLICLLTRWRVAYILFLGFIIIAPFYRDYTSANIIWSTKSYLSNMGAISIGCLAAIMTNKKSFPLYLSRCMSVFSFAGILLTIGIFRRLLPDDLWSYRLDRDLLSIFTAIFLVFCSQIEVSRFTRVIFFPFARMGKVSYEMYLFHMFFVFWGVDIYSYYGKNLAFSLPVLLGIIVSTYITSLLIERSYSNPLNNFIRNYKIKKKSPEVSI
jgi:peptidoglycan/LPS O-acetylase OafA/YrhL